MRKLIIISTVFLFTASLIHAQSREFNDLEPFENVSLDGNIRLNLEYGSATSLILEAKKEHHLSEYDVEVRNGTLYIRVNDRGYGSTPKLTVNLTHPGIQQLDMDGLVHVNSTNTYKSEKLVIQGDGLIKGDLDVTVNELKIGLDGMCKLTVVGYADVADLRLDGLGKIDARGLRADQYNHSSDGIASIKVGGR